MRYQIKLSACAVALVLAGLTSATPMEYDMDFVDHKVRPVDLNQDPPNECSSGAACGDTSKINEAIKCFENKMDLPLLPVIKLTGPRGEAGERGMAAPGAPGTLRSFEPELKDRTCEGERLEHKWLILQGEKGAVGVRFFNVMSRMKCGATKGKSPCNFMSYHGDPTWCVAGWESRTFNVLWPQAYLQDAYGTGHGMECCSGYCLVRMKLKFPDTCMCVKCTTGNQCQSSGAPGSK